MSGRTTYPQDWFLKPLGEVCRVEIGGTPSRNVPRFWASEGQKGYPWVAISDLGSKWIHKTAECITGAGVNNSNVKLVPRGTVLMSFKLTLGRVGLAGVDLYTNEAIAAFFPDYSHVSDDWLYHVLPTIAETGSAEQAIKGQTLNKDKIQRLILHLPSLPEQRRIAEILDAADEAVHQTEVVITKLKALKAGLLHDLLTRGLDEHGRLRDPEAHPEQFQDSVLGRIPREWEIRQMGEVLEMQLGKMLNKAARIGHNPYPYLANRNVQWDRVDLSDLEWMDFTASERERFRLLPGDLLVCEGGEVGRTAMWNGEMEDCYFQKAIHRLRPKDSSVLAGYVLRFMRFAVDEGLLTAFTSQTSITHLTQEKLAALPLPLPTWKEQRAILKVADAHDDRIRVEEATLAKLRQVKRGLMDDLLTGRVRV